MKKNTIRLIAVALLITMVLFLASCGGSKPDNGSGGSADNGNTAQTDNAEKVSSAKNNPLRIAVSGDSGTLDPMQLGGGASFKNISLMYAEPLFDIDENGDFVWMLATGIDVTGPTQWIVHLREGVKFTNGNPFNAEDVLFTLTKNNTDERLPPSIPTLDLEKSKVIDDYTVELNFVSYDLTVKGNMPTVQMFDAETFDAQDYALNPVGTGPYTVQEYVINSHIYLQANKEYWGTKPQIENLQFKVMDEPAQIVNAIQAGTIDVATVPSSDIDFVKTLPEYSVKLLSSGSTDAVWFNTTTTSIFNNRDARKAVCHAVNRESVVTLAYFGYATIPSWPLPMNYVDYDPKFSTLDDTYTVGYDVELAKQYADKGGLTSKDVRIATNGSSTSVTMAEVIQQNLRDIGVNATITNYDMATWFNITMDTSLYDLFIWSMYSPSFTAAQMYYGWFVYMPCFNQGTWDGIDRFGELANAVEFTFDETERAQQISELTEILERESIWYAIDEPQTAVVYNANLDGIAFMKGLSAYYGNWSWK